MLWQLIQRLWQLLPRALEFVSTFQGGLFGEVIILIVVYKIADPLIDGIYKLIECFAKTMQKFEK